MDRFSIISSSCIKPGWPYVPWEDSRAVKGVEKLGRFIESMERKPEMMLFLGDFICSSFRLPTYCPRGSGADISSLLPIKVAELTTSVYRQLYHQIYASPSWTRDLLDLSWIHMFDDHGSCDFFLPREATLGR